MEQVELYRDTRESIAQARCPHLLRARSLPAPRAWLRDASGLPLGCLLPA